ncbi:small subunit processome component 20 homolog [Musca domestica]|uniref:Small subunit processome component 20 homolog n=1 Tax=Musca domestica TaxID=7370 RepID=A0ABM3V1M0_MUSDO|nr:small subunit processome component 20 homolog [Musca domestica]
MAELNEKTKNSNTFRFKSFAERVNEIDLRRLALYHIGHENEDLVEENETYFHQTLRKWMVLNLTTEFSQFSRKVVKVVTLPQLLHQKDFVIDTLLDKLSCATNLSLQPLLELLYVLARDLREEFYQYFQRVLDRLICLLNTQDAEQLEWTLVCLAYLFKTLKPYLKRNIGIVFHSILPLLDERRYEEHVTNFAVECFSFIARDVKEYGKFLDFVLSTVSREQIDSIQGCGRLLFEIMRGVKGQFHSTAGDFLQFIFEALAERKDIKHQQLNLLHDIVEHTVLQLIKFITSSQMSLFWTKLCAVADSQPVVKKLKFLMKIALQVIEFKDGRLLSEMDVIVATILGIIDRGMLDEKSSEDTLLLTSNVICSILLSGSSLVTQLDTSRLMKKALTIKNRSIYDEFVLSMALHVQFDIFILPSLVQYLETNFDLQAIELMARVITKKHPLNFNSCSLDQWQSMEIKVNSVQTIIRIEDSLEKCNSKSKEFEQNLLLLIMAPHIKGLKAEKIQKSLEYLMKSTVNEMQASKTEDLKRPLNTLTLLIEIMWQLDLFPPKDILKPLTEILLNNLQYKNVLGSLNQLISKNSKLFKHETRLIPSLSYILQHHDHDYRLLAAQSLSVLFKGQETQTPYHIFYQTELIEPNIHNYREQILLIQKLETQTELFKSFKEATYKNDCIRFLLGMLYHNFKFVWEPTLKLLEDYAKEVEPATFWSIYQDKMQKTLDSVDYSKEHFNQEDEVIEEIWNSKTMNAILPLKKERQLTQQQILNYRILLWQHLPQFGKLFEMKNRDLVAIFLKFIEEEYQQHLEKKENCWDLNAMTNKKIDLDLDEVDKEDETKAKFKRVAKIGGQDNARAKFILQTLQCKLSVLAVQQNPRALFKETELWHLYMQLLKGSNNQLQKCALDCVMSYKSKSLMPYKELFYNILDEKKFKDELLNFKVDTVSEEHREQFMHIFLRLLYGKMITKGSQKGLSPQQRKSIILRFLGQCKLTEIEWFMQMAFGLYTQFTDEANPIEQIPKIVRTNFNISAVWSPKKLQSVVNLLELIRKEFGGIMQETFHVYMLKLLVFIGATCNEVLSLNASLLHPKMPIVFRNLKQNALESLVNFFEHIEEFEWKPTIVACLTNVFVYPSLEKLPLECIHAPTSLLKLLLLWGEKPKHFHFLSQAMDGSEKTIFHYIIALLLNDKSKALVRKPIMGLIERLLVASESELEFSDDGLALVKPFIPELLQRLKMNFSSKGSKQSLDKRDLNILSMLTKHVEEPEICDSLLELLLPILIAKTQTQSNVEVVSQVITTLSNLIKRLERPEMYVRKIAPLFEHVSEVSARKQLCDLIADIAKIKHKQAPNSPITKNLKFTARIMILLNAWDKRWVEQPDYEKRLDALKELKEQIESPEGLDMDLGVLVIFNCIYFLRHDKDMGLRDNASEHLRLLLPHLTKKYSTDKQQMRYLVGDIFLNLIRRIIKDANENVRNEGIRLLGEMVRECPDSHEILKDLSGLGDKLDPEVDFFENMIHLQSHRHGRALLKFNAMSATLSTPPCVRTLTQIILPLASRYLLQEKHASKHTLVDAAIETVGVVCQLLPWQHYYTILRYYLMKMRSSHDYQKQCVRIVVRILDAFHFDLTLSQNDAETIEKLKATIKTDDHNELEQTGVKDDQANEDKKGDDDDEGDETSRGTEEDNLEEALENNIQLVEDEVSNKEEGAAKGESCMKRPLLLSCSASKKVLTTITSILIPTLNRSITEQSSYDTKHKVNRKRLSIEREEEEILRVPIALALVKLMQKLPKELMDSSLPGVFMKVCTFLRSPLKSVRMLTRDILKKIMLCLGSEYLSMLVSHLQNLLTRGFQVHVLSVTIHGVLDALRDVVQPGDIECCLHNLLEVALNDIFGDVSAEKEVDRLTSHTPEAKPSAKSYLVLHIIARNIQENCLLDLLLPFKDHLARSKSRKLTLKIQECFAKIVNGLVENAHISRESLLIFIYGTISESITDLLPGIQRRVLSEQEKEKMRRARPDCFIIQPPPQRSGALNKKIKTNAQANAHILIEFGLEMLHIVLKRKKLQNIDYEPFINPILPLLRDSLKSTHIRVTTFALKCFATLWVEEYELKAMKDDEYLKSVVARMFEILKNFSTFGATKQEDNFQLMKSAFKAIVALLRKCTYYDLTEEQVDELILYVEQDLHDGENQSMTFNLLKALLNRKVQCKAIHDIMKKIGEMCVVSPSEYVRDESRNLLTTYVMEYPLNKKVDHIVKFFTVQLCFSLSAGRLSAIEFICTVIKKFPLTILTKKAEFLYISLGTRLVNDEDPECRKAVANCIEILIGRLEKSSRQHLFDLTLLFFKANNKPSVREMGAALCSRFLCSEKQSFAPRLKVLLPTLVARLNQESSTNVGRFVRAPHTDSLPDNDVSGIPKKKKYKSKQSPEFIENKYLEKEVNEVLQDKGFQEEEEELERKQRSLDHEMIQVQYCLLKVFEYCSSELLKISELTSVVDELAYESQRLLAHDHNWVRCNAAKIIGHILSGYDFDYIGRKLSQADFEDSRSSLNKLDFIYLNPEYDIKSLVLDLCAQMIPGETSQLMIDEIVKIFLYIATMLKDVPFSVKRQSENIEDDQENMEDKEPATNINLNWLLKQIRFLINKEVVKASHSTSMRMSLFTLLEGLITLLNVDQLQKLGPGILGALVREMSEEDQNVDADLRQVALRVGSRLRKRVGSDVYDKLRANAQMKLMIRRADRKKVLAQEKIHDPVRAAKRKVAIQARKKSAKKLKASVMRGKTVDLKQKLKKRKRKADDILF